METLALGIEGMTCGGCAANIERLLYRVEGVDAATVSFAAGEAEIKFNTQKTNADALSKVIADAGYGVTLGAAAKAD